MNGAVVTIHILSTVQEELDGVTLYNSINTAAATFREITQQLSEANETMVKRYKLCFYGIVQGVGFRYTAMHAANMYRLTGYVKNEYDGSVTCEVQGDEEAIDRFITTVQSGRFISISEINRQEMNVISDERFFDVRY